ncbi:MULTISPECIES: hypothetical protein [Paracoccus]|uniref:hypothetical protein n=1 Tax=Paracoccus TaxID=265 RepID=UPI000CEBA476|nr:MULTISPECIES: hypothetical protein [Paracoccus]MDK8872256.1 hypothetical protein [Paracoccus sp. SSJ]
MRVLLRDTHAYRGCRLALPDGVPDRDRDVIVGFSDGIEVPGRLTVTQTSGPVLDIAAYRTARGTRIVRKSWRLRQDNEGWVIAARLAAEP